MKNKGIWLVVVIFLFGGVGWSFREKLVRKWFKPREVSVPKTDGLSSAELEYEVVASELEVPWELVFLPDGELLVTERPGRLVKIGLDKSVVEVEGVEHIGEGGLLGLALHPSFAENRQIYLYLTSRVEGGLVNRVERYRFEGESLTDREVILAEVPGASYHDGGRIKFGVDGKLYVTTGDAGKTELSQDKESLAGKILRLNEDGSVPEDNSFGDFVFSYGHRNPQGIDWDDEGRMWATEHGPSGFDEINLIEKGSNYGWPEAKGDEESASFVGSSLTSGAEDTWAPSGMEIDGDRMFFGGLRGESLFELEIKNDKLSGLKRHFFREFGRIRFVRKSPDGEWYVATNNRDGRGSVQKGDDKIIKIKNL